MDDEWIVVNGATVVDQRGDEHAVVAHVAYYDDGLSDGPTWGGRVEGLSLDVAHGLLTEPGRRILRIAEGREGEIVPVVVKETREGAEMDFRGVYGRP